MRKKWKIVVTTVVGAFVIGAADGSKIAPVDLSPTATATIPGCSWCSIHWYGEPVGQFREVVVDFYGGCSSTSNENCIGCTAIQNPEMAELCEEHGMVSAGWEFYPSELDEHCWEYAEPCYEGLQDDASLAVTLVAASNSIDLVKLVKQSSWLYYNQARNSLQAHGSCSDAIVLNIPLTPAMGQALGAAAEVPTDDSTRREP